MTVNTVAPIPASYAELIGEAVTLHSAHEKVGFGLKEWEITAKSSGGVSFPVKAFIELKTAFELAGIDLDNPPHFYEGNEALYTVTVAWDAKHKRLTFDKLMFPNGDIKTLDAEAWDKRRERVAPIIPELRGAKKQVTLADKMAELERLAISLFVSFPVEGSRNKTHAGMILRSAWAMQGKDTKAPMPKPHGVSAVSGKEKAAKIEALALEISQLTGSDYAALVVMDCMAIQGRVSPLKGKPTKRK